MGHGRGLLLVHPKAIQNREGHLRLKAMTFSTRLHVLLADDGLNSTAEFIQIIENQLFQILTLISNQNQPRHRVFYCV